MKGMALLNSRIRSFNINKDAIQTLYQRDSGELTFSTLNRKQKGVVNEILNISVQKTYIAVFGKSENCIY